MNNLATEREHKNMLYDFYGGLLTEKQREIYTMHHDEDCSLAEIGEIFGITPQAVSDTIKRANGKLNNYEEKLRLVEKHRIHKKMASQIDAKLLELEEIPDISQKVKIIRSVIASLV